MADGVQTPPKGCIDVKHDEFTSYVAIEFQDKTEVQNTDLRPADQSSTLKRIQTNSNILQITDKSTQIVISLDDLCAWVPTVVVPGGQGKSSWITSCLESKGQTQPAKERQILFNVSGEVNPGEMLALMGPSGSGKTSLLTLMGGRSTARLEGQIAFNGTKMSKAVKRKLGYVMQDDLLFAELTVYETLYYAALLRLPRSWSRADKLTRVELVVSGLGLERCRDTIIGSHMMRGVSGGERKRVSIGHELLINPSMLLLDEPTSGLDSTTALRLMHTLRSLAEGGRTIVTSIHQPSSRLYRQMDKLMLLAQGHCMYYGDAQCVATWFKRLGQPCPFGTNLADHILDLANGDIMTGSGGGSMMASGRKDMGDGGVRCRGGSAGVAAAAAKYDTHDVRMDDRPLAAVADGCSSGTMDSSDEVQRQLIDAYKVRTIGRGRGGILTSELEFPASPEGSDTSSVGCGPGKSVANGIGGTPDRNLRAPALEGTSEGAEPQDKWGAPWVQQVRYLSVRSVKTRRLQSLSAQKFLQLLVVAVLTGMFWWQIGAKLDSDQSVLDVGGLLFFIELFMAFSTLFAALFTFPLEFQMLVKERQSGMYRLSAYYLARTLADLPMDCLLPSIFVCIIYWMSGLRVDAGAFFAHWASVLLIVLTSQSVGLLIGATVTNPQNGQTIATIYMLASMLVGGYYVRGMPVWIQWMKYCSFIYWGWNLLLKVEFVHRPYSCALNAAGAAGGGAQRCTVQQAGIFNLNVDAPVTRDVCVLIGMMIFIRLCVYYALKFKTTFKGHK